MVIIETLFIVSPHLFIRLSELQNSILSDWIRSREVYIAWRKLPVNIVIHLKISYSDVVGLSLAKMVFSWAAW